ncbi:hypothetical protein AB1286_28145 [Trinickia sp. NRRL B-1857]|uniref:hypothetical protein n=1 Tax=Trinickia sp. NRRL B-1857 TaxID=3162879 RepID=UPI003D2DF3AD
MNLRIVRIRRAIRTLLTFIALAAALGVTYWIVQLGSISECITFGVLALGWVGWVWLRRPEMSGVGRHVGE